jgi:tripartite ATP-independent transporter DctM subunit
MDVAILFIIVIGGIYAGVFTPTEAAGIGAFGTFVCSIFRRKMNSKIFINSLLDTISPTGMLFLILLGATILGYFLSVSRLPFEIASFVSAMPVNRYVILISILFILILLGCIMDTLAIIMLTIPIFYPLIQSLGFDLIYFGILVVRVTELGLISPPIGMNIFIIQGISGAKISHIYKGVIPFIVADFISILLLIGFPQISLFLPSLMSQ